MTSELNETKHHWFKKMVDDLIINAQDDQELTDGLKWLDIEARKQNLDFYEMVFVTLYNHEMNTRVKDWREQNR